MVRRMEYANWPGLGRMPGNGGWDWMLGRGKIAEMGVVVHEGCGLTVRARLGDGLLGSTGNPVLLQVPGREWGRARFLGFIPPAHCLSSLCQTDQTHSFLLR